MFVSDGHAETADSASIICHDGMFSVVLACFTDSMMMICTAHCCTTSAWPTILQLHLLLYCALLYRRAAAAG
jgi:hypothetical protein